MLQYGVDKLNYYVERLKELNYYVARRTEKDNTVVAYLISATDWRHSVILECSAKNCFRLSILFVDSGNAHNFTENEFDNFFLEKLEKK